MNIMVFDPFTVTILLTSAMALLASIVYILILSIRRARVTQIGEEMYIGGESEDILSLKVPSVLALYWGIIKRSWKDAFNILRDVIHSGILNEWYGYMSIWLSFLLLLSIIAIAIYMYIR
uniref:Sodium:proton antiporter n=1 Tax=Ignisphaera aggregans TaxID=334771 RepID=A0A7C5TLY9_9CREN